MKWHYFSLYFLLGLSPLFTKATQNFPNNFRFAIAPQLGRLKMDVNTIGVFEGTVYGAFTSFEYKPMDWFFAGGYINWLMGNVHAQQQMDRYIHDLDSKVRVGYTMQFLFWRYVSFTPFIGLGYDYTLQHFRPDLVLNSRKYKFYDFYIPVGGLFKVVVTPHFSFGLNLEWDPQINSRMKIDGIPGIKWDLFRKSGYMVEVPFSGYLGLKNGSSIEFSFVPYLKWMQDGELEAVLLSGSTYSLPKQTYKFWVARFEVAYNF